MSSSSRSRRLRALVGFLFLTPAAWFASRAYVATARPKDPQLSSAAKKALERPAASPTPAMTAPSLKPSPKP